MDKTYNNIHGFSHSRAEVFSANDLMPAIFTLVIITQYIYLFSYNYVPEGARSALSGILAVFHVAMAAAAIAFRGRMWNIVILAAFVLMVLTWTVSHGFGFSEVSGFDARLALRKAVLFLMFIWMLAYPLALPVRVLIFFAVFGTILGGIIALTGEPIQLGGHSRLATITGGLTQMHPSARFIAVQIILLDVLRRAGLLMPKFAWPLILFGIAILIGYLGRNELVFVGIYYCSLMYFRYRHEPAIKWSILPIGGLIVVAAVVALLTGTNVQDYGSGRIGTWQHRLGLIWDRDFITFLVGGGVDSDFIFTPQWDFAEAFQSHNDFIHYMMENGLLGLIALCALFGALWGRLPETGKAILLGVIATSFFDNGFLQQPLLALNLALVLALSILGWQLKHLSGTVERPGSGGRTAATTG